MIVSERILGLLKSGPKNCTQNFKIRANYAQMYPKIHIKFRGYLRQVQQGKLVGKIDEDRTAEKIDIYTRV